MPKLLMIHGGGPTPVLNASLYGAIQAANLAEAPIFGAQGGTGGVLADRFVALPRADKGLLSAPGSVLGSSRTPLSDADYPRLAKHIRAAGFTHVLMTGGNGTQATAARLAATGLPVIGIPKTVDNDLAGVDHAPGYLSGAWYAANTINEIKQDLAGLPIHVVIVELMGRHAGWLTAAASLAKPDLLYLPEQAFSIDAFLQAVVTLYAQKGAVLVVVPEGLRDACDQLIAPPSYEPGYTMDVSTKLVRLVQDRLHLRARGEKPGLAGRASIAWQAPQDLRDAINVGRTAVEAVLNGATNQMVGLTHDGQTPLVAFEPGERLLPTSFVGKDRGVTPAFDQWLQPLLPPLTPAIKLG